MLLPRRRQHNLARPVHVVQYNEQRRWKPQSPLRRPIAPCVLGYPPTASSQPRKLSTPRSHNNHRRSYLSHTTLNCWCLATDTQSNVRSDPVLPRSPPEVNQEEYHPFPALPEDPNFDTMPYPYQNYTDGANAESHIRSFVDLASQPFNASSHRY